MKEHMTDWVFRRFLEGVDVDPSWEDLREYVEDEIYFDRDATRAFIREALDFVDWDEIGRWYHWGRRR